MGLDFDVVLYCKQLLKKSKQPPFNCPVDACEKSYKSLCGLQYHLINFDHDEKEKKSTAVTPEATKNVSPLKKKGTNKSSLPEVKTLETIVIGSNSKNCKYVDFEIDEKNYKVSVEDPVSIISNKAYERLHPSGSSNLMGTSKSQELLSNLPEALYSPFNDYKIVNAPAKPLGYIRYIEKNNDDLDGEVEYDIDEEDAAWLDLINERRQDQNLGKITIDMFELLMDRLEKESFFLMTTNKSDIPALVDDDAVCCICMDGECQNSNVILFCDMCNLAVHQECYGVPYIPEGQWLCRRCLQSPSRAVDCVLCPNTGGAFKQTDRGHWAHVVCALWIPEVRFANTVFLEPIDSIETIPPARWKLTCCLCKQKGIGACIQCYKSNCYTAFHVTCAQLAGLCMRMDEKEDSTPVIVEKIAYCSAHSPEDYEVRPNPNFNAALNKINSKPSTPPVISIPTIPPDRIQEIGSLVTISKKNQFIQRLIAYWTLKRQLRNGVPLLRRLQPTNLSRRGDSENDGKSFINIEELRSQLQYWQRIRQHLETARLLTELVRKREKLKRELVKVKEKSTELELFPLVSFLRRLVDLLRTWDTREIFIDPVNLNEVPNYSQFVKKPMDLTTMRQKVDAFKYNSIEEFREDFNLMINNCLSFNSKNTVFHRAALKMKEQGEALLSQAQLDFQSFYDDDDYKNVLPSRSLTSSPKGHKYELDFRIITISNDNSLGTEEKISSFQQLLNECSKNNDIACSEKVKEIEQLIRDLKQKRNNVKKSIRTFEVDSVEYTSSKKRKASVINKLKKNDVPEISKRKSRKKDKY